MADLNEGDVFYKSGSKTSEFKLLVGVLLASLVNPLMNKYLGAQVDPMILASLLFSAASYALARTGLKARLARLAKKL